MSVILLRPIGSTTVQNQQSIFSTIAPGQTVAVDAVPDSTFSIRWSVTTKNPISGKATTYELLVQNKSGSVSSTRYAILGDYLPHSVNVSVVSGNLVLEITNNNVLEVIEVNALRVVIS